MPTIGPHETARRLVQTGTGGIYLLKTDQSRVIKVLRAPVTLWTDDAIREEVDGFRLSAKTQKAAANQSKHWAPIYEIAALRHVPDDALSDELSPDRNIVASGAYQITQRYERSAQTLIDSRVNLLNTDLRNIMSGIIQGLIDLRKTAHRAHGNLKPPNVLLNNTADLAAATVHLSDPAPDGFLTKNSFDKDLTDLGNMLYELVNLRPHAGGTVGRSDDWDELGPNGEDWRKLCNNLLDVQAPAESRDLEKILPQLQTWTAKPRKNRKPMMIAASIILFMIAGGFTWWWMTRPPKLAYDAANWEKLCLSYHQWFGDFANRMADENTRNRFRGAGYPTEVVQLFNDAKSELEEYEPKILARKPDDALKLAINPTDAAKTGYSPYYTQQGVKLIEATEKALSPEKWPLLKNLDTVANQYNERGWGKAAAGVRTVVDSAQPPPLPKDPLDIAERAKLVKSVNIVTNIDKTIAANRSIDDINTHWNQIVNRMNNLPPQVPLLQRFSSFVTDLPKSTADPAVPGSLTDVTALQTSFTEIDKTLTQLLGEFTTGKQIAYEELAKDPAAQVPADGSLSLKTFAALPAIADGYIKITDDPRRTVDWKKSIADVQENFIVAIRTSNDQDKNLPTLVANQAALEKKTQDWESIPAIEKNRDQLVALVNSAKTELKSLQDNGAAWLSPYRTDPDAYVRDHETYITSTPLARATPLVYDQWKVAYNRLLTKVVADKPRIKMDYRYKLATDDKFAKLESVYIAFDAAIPVRVPGLADIATNDWKQAIATRISVVHRLRAIRDLMTDAALPWADDVPLVEDPAYVSYRTRRLAEFEKLRTDALALIQDYSTITDRLDHLDLLANEPTAGSKTWRELSDTWKQNQNPLLADETITAAIKPINDRVAALQAVDGVTEYPVLLQQVRSPANEIALSAWRKLGSATITEQTPVLQDEDRLATELSTRLTTAQQQGKLDAVHVQKLTAELVAQRPIRWQRWADLLTTPATIQEALDKADSFKINITAQSNASMYYNKLLYDLRKQFDKNLKEAELKPIAKQFIDAVTPLPAAQNAEIKDLLARMTKSITQTPEEISAAGAGPQLAGWEMDKSREAATGIRTFYFPNKAASRHVLEFVRFTVDSKVAGVGSKTIYLCTTEMSVGLFMDIMNAAPRFADVDNTGKPTKEQHWFKVPAKQADDVWLDQGPRSWKILNKKFALNDKWLFQAIPQMGATPYYPQGGAAADPTANDPMQLLSPWSAMYGARLLGCRLPTSDEWKTAYDRFEQEGAKDIWNLRGEGPAGRGSWRTQQTYATEMSARGLKFPDQGIFLTADQIFAATPITDTSAKPWTADALAKLVPNRFTAGATPYKNNSLWFRPVGSEPGKPSGGGGFHDLVGNVAEYVFDAPNANAVIKDNTASAADINAAIAAGPAAKRKDLFVIGGSALSPPEILFNVKQECDPLFPQTASGYCDVGFRLAFTAPIDSIVDVLASTFKEPHYLPGPKARP